MRQRQRQKEHEKGDKTGVRDIETGLERKYRGSITERYRNAERGRKHRDTQKYKEVRRDTDGDGEEKQALLRVPGELFKANHSAQLIYFPVRPGVLALYKSES